MSDLIKREDAIKAMEQRYEDILRTFKRKVKIGEKAIVLDMIGCVKNLPSADRPQGEWIGCRHEDSEWLSPMADFYKCSICGKIVNLLQMRSYKYCPNCGSRMSKGADDE